MAAQDRKIFSTAHGVFFLLSALAEIFLNITPLACYMPWRFSWCLVVVPALLAAGFIGRILTMSILIFLGWVGIGYFTLSFLSGIIGDLNYGAGDFGYPTFTESLSHRALIDEVGRLAGTMILSVSLAVYFKKCAIKSCPPGDLTKVL